MRRLLTTALAMMILAGCAKVPAPAPSTEATAPPETKTPTPAKPEPSWSIEANLPIPVPLPDGIQRVELPAGQAIEQPGLYYMDVATGKLEGWLPPTPDPRRPMARMDTTPDHRWLTYSQQDHAYLIRRADGQAFRYNPGEVWVVPGPGLLLVGPTHGQPRSYAIVNDEMKLLSTFSLPTAPRGTSQFLFSPDGTRLAAALEGGLSIVDVATGEATTLAPLQGDWPVPTNLPQLGEFVVRAGTQIKRFDWEGKPTGEMELETWHVQISPDGRLLSYAQSMGRYGQAIVVQEWGSETPLFRIAGALGSTWTADSSALITDTRLGWQMVSTTGNMRTPPEAGDAHWHAFQWYRPSPDNPDLFLTATRVINRAGQTVQATAIKDPTQALVATAGWGPTAAEVHIVVTSPIGKDWDQDLSANFLPAVQRPPFEETYPLQVRDPKGECLNLREEPSTSGPVIRCLPTRTRFSATMAQNEIAGADDATWIVVQTEQGETGWVAITTGSISYAD